MWEGALSLDFARSGQRTVIARRRHQGPLLVQRAFHEPDGGCQVYVIHPPGGVVGGDRLSTHAVLAPGARALLTTPAATKIYRSIGNEARIEQRFELGAGAVLEWLPQETIAYDGARACGRTHISLSPDAHFIGWEVLCLGRDASGFGRGRLVQACSMERGGTSLWSERAVFPGGGSMLTAPWGLAGRPVTGTLVATGAAPGLVEAARCLEPSGADWYSATQLGEVLVCRYLGYSAEAAKRLFEKTWGILRDRVLAREAHPPRVWAT